MRTIRSIPLGLTLFIFPAIACAHGEAPRPKHGGVVQESQELWLELVVKDNDVSVFVLDETQKPVPASQISGTATVLVGGKSYKVDLVAEGAESVSGKLPVAASGRLIATVALKVGAKSLSARFTAQ